MQKYNKNGAHYTVLGLNKVHDVSLLIWCLIRKCPIQVNREVQNFISAFHKWGVFRRFEANYIQYYDLDTRRYAGYIYKLTAEANQITQAFFDHHFQGEDNVLEIYKAIFKSNKIEGYIKRNISINAFLLLKELFFLHEKPDDMELLICDSALNRFVLNHFKTVYGSQIKAHFVKPTSNFFCLSAYYLKLLKNLFTRGISFKKNKRFFKIAKEAMFGFNSKVLNDDFFVDNRNIKKGDVCFLSFQNELDYKRKEAVESAKEKGYHVVNINKVPVNFSEGYGSFLYFYLILPLKLLFKLRRINESWAYLYFLFFHSAAFFIECLMRSYRFDIYLSGSDFDDIVPTIIMNRYGTKTALYPWSDLSFAKTYSHCYIAHNLYLSWGELHHATQFHLNKRYVDRIINVGSIYKQSYQENVCKRSEFQSQVRKLDPLNKTVVFFDNGFGGRTRHPAELFVEFIALLDKFCERFKNVNIILKRKKLCLQYEKYVPDHLQERFEKAWTDLVHHDHFIFEDQNRFEITEFLTIADMCVSMGINSTSTVALICGIDALYFDITGNNQHVMAKNHFNEIVFNNMDALMDQSDRILSGKFKCADVITQEEMRGLDCFEDDKVKERIIKALFQSDPISIVCHQ